MLLAFLRAPRYGADRGLSRGSSVWREAPPWRHRRIAAPTSSQQQQHEAASLDCDALSSSDGVWTMPLRLALQLPAAAAGGTASIWAQLMGLTFAFQALVALMFQGCIQRGELGCTTCQRMLLACLLPIASSLLVLQKAAAGGCTSVWLAIAAALQIGGFAVYVPAYLQHHPWFLHQVLWPLVIALGLSECLAGVASQLALGHGSSGPLQPLLTALLSVKAARVLSRLLRSAVPRLSSSWLLPALRWATKRALPRLAASLAKVLPRGGRFAARLAARLSRLILRMAGRMAPRYVQDQVAGTTQQLAFPQADGLLTDAVARSIDLLPPKRRASCVYLALMLAQLGMLLAAYSPCLMFAELPAAAAADAALLRFVKFMWGSGCLVAAFACNCLKTAADRGHLARPANRQANLALALLQAGTALVLLQGMHAGAVAASSWAAWVQLTAAAAGAVFCSSVAGALPGAAAGAAERPPAVPQSMPAPAAMVDAEPHAPPPLSSAEWQVAEHGDPSYAAALSGTALALTLLQLAL